MATSYNGYSVIESGSDNRLHKWVVPGTDRYFLLRAGSTGFLLAFLISWFHQNVQKLNLKGDVWDEWAYAYRFVRGASFWSNHASATAIDLNATRYPLGRMVMAAWRKAKIRMFLRTRMHGVIRWGGNYEGRKDEMHFEINADIVRCEKLARRLMKTKRGKRILAANPTQRRVILS